jgi:phosphoenolpyruvate carboxylase
VPVTDGSTATSIDGRRPEDQPLHDDVRTLAGLLGQTIRRHAGEAHYEAVEGLRAACRSRRRGEADAAELGALRARLEHTPLPVLTTVARAFTLFFLLINTAEQVHRARRRDARRDPRQPAQPASARWTVERLRDAGLSAEQAAEHLGRVEIRPVLTAHPTESTRRTVLALQARVASILRSDADPAARERDLFAEIELLWLTSEVRRDRPSVADEVSTVLWYLEERLLPASTSVVQAFATAFQDVYEAPLTTPPAIVLGSWVGGDRDGNPFVTPTTTLAATRRATFATLRRYHQRVERLIGVLSVSASLAPATPALLTALDVGRVLLPRVHDANRKRDADEPLRLLLTFVAARLAVTRDVVAARDAGQPRVDPAAYPDADALLADLDVAAGALRAAGASGVLRAHLDPLIREISAQRFAGFRLDVREDSGAIERAVAHLAQAAGLAPLDTDGLRRELSGRRPLVAAHTPLDDDTRVVFDVFDALVDVHRESGPEAASTYVVSMAHSADDLLRVLLLAQQKGFVDLTSDPPRSALDVVPLFETRDDLLRAADVLDRAFQDPVYRRQLAARGDRQEVMIGYSDSAKDAGVLPAAWALYVAQEQITEVGRRHGVATTLFHGRGGTVGRGGGSPVWRALAALPPGTIGGRTKLTEQGEIISQKFGLPEIAVRSLEVLASGTALADLSDWRQDVPPDDATRFRGAMERLVATSWPIYRRWVHEEERVFQLFLTCSPVRELAHAHYGSRPAYREKGAGTMAGIRAIPWIFGWTQNRLLLPTWLGAGSALAALLADAGGEELLRDMDARWPFFSDLLSKIEMVVAKSDPDVARLYVDVLGGDPTLLDELLDELERTRAAVGRIRGSALADQPFLGRSIALRNPYVDALSLVQVELLRRKRAGADDVAELDAALGTTLNGVAQGMRNTG